MNGEERAVLDRVDAALKDIDVLKVNYAASQKDLSTLSQGYAVQQNNIINLIQKVEEIGKKIDEKSHVNWQAIGVFVAILLFALPGLGFYMNTVVAPVNAATELNTEAIRSLTTNVQILQQSAASSTAADVNSRTDRDQLNARVKDLENSTGAEITSRREQDAMLRESQIEVETQIQAIYNLMNSSKAEDQKIFAILWQKLFPNTQFPDDNYYPRSTISPAPGIAAGSGGGK